MKIVYGDLWTYEEDHPDRWTLITTNGTVKADGANVMGSGCAREWADRNPDAPFWLGTMLKQHGNHCYSHKEDRVITFPTKEDVWKGSPMATIIRSCNELAFMANTCPDHLFVLPRPGVGAGGLKWEDVEPVIAPLLPDNVHVITWS